MMWTVSVITIAAGAACAAIVLWPVTVKPVLRRRYEREHFRKKGRGRHSR